MSDTAIPRRQPPSPLIFSPETVLSPIASTSQAQKHGSGSNTVSMPFIKRHVTRRLKTAKQECDKDLQRVTHAITVFFEERLREGEQDLDQSDVEYTTDSPPFNFPEQKSAFQADDASSDGGYDVEFEGNRSIRQRASSNEANSNNGLTRWSSSPGLLAASLASSPASLRRQNTLPKDKPPLPVSVSSATLSPNETSPRKSGATAIPPTSWSNQGRASRRLSRTIHIPMRPSRSGQSSRSTSRSRSPLPGSSAHNSFQDISTSPNRRSSRILVDDPVDPIMSTLYDIIAVATDVQELTIAQLTANPKICSQMVQRVQNIGKAWDEHPDWHGRNWYVQVLLAVASLSRVVEWWEAEKQFWNFDDEDDDDQVEPFTFLLKPAEEAAPTPTIASGVDTTSKQLVTGTEDDGRLRLSRNVSHQLRPREDLRSGHSPAAKDDSPGRLGNKHLDTAESARVLATERLRLQAEKAQSQNIVLELSIDGDHILWVNYAWENIVGSNPQDMVGTRLSHLMAPNNWNAFREATERLLADDSHTIEVRFKLSVEPEQGVSVQGRLYREMEGKGMLMLDHVDGQPSHTMWVIKPIGPPVLEHAQTPIPEAIPLPKDANDEGAEEPATPFPFDRPISTAVILCRICENNIPEWFFEKHNETCNDVHKLEAEIGECNESIVELRNTIRELRLALDRSSPVSIPEYRGVPIFSSNSSPSSSLQMFRPHLKMQRMGVKKMQKRLLEQLDDILQVALEVSLPALKEEESKEPIERQRLLSPNSERKIQQVRTWNKPNTEDPALMRLVNDVDTLMRTKMDNVTRMQNTIRYSEKVRQEWEEKLEATIAAMEGVEIIDEDAETAEGENEEFDHDSTTSEYAFDGSTATASEPTPMASEKPTPAPSSSSTASSQSGNSRTVVRAVQQPTPVYHSQGLSLFTRSSTPSSVSSPLALAEPIVASQEPEPMSLSASIKHLEQVAAEVKTEDKPSDSSTETEKPVEQSADAPDDKIPEQLQQQTDKSTDPSPATIRPKSVGSLEPRVTITPPISPSIAPREGAPLRTRRLSILCPNGSSGGPLSPRIPSVMPSRSTPTSIKDFEIIKPISKGAFGSVFLAKKRVTGDYYAIKVLKKADMIAKNQITNVKAERMILMNQAESPFVAKLYFTFQSKENLYLVMEYLNGGDCAALIKSLGCLPEEWTKNYIAEVVLGLEYLHQRGIVHRDLKPDNLLIDQHGHLKLTDFGLSKIGFLGRQTRDTSSHSVERPRPRTRYSPGSRPPSMDSAYLSYPLLTGDVISGGSYFSQRTGSTPQIATSPHPISGTPTDDISESSASGSDSLSGLYLRRNRLNDSPQQSFATELTTDLRSHAATPGGLGTPPGEQKFVGTPDYLAPESILGMNGEDYSVDWWALGVITYEFLYGFPPFHAETPEKVFENILSGHVDWHEEWIDFSPEALDFMKRLLTTDVSQRLGAHGAEEVKAHPFFKGIDWETVTTNEAAFIPQVTDPESTDYFDLRGASTQLLHDDDIPAGQSASTPAPLGSPSTAPVNIVGHDVTSPTADDFGSFSFKNLPVLKQANDDVIRKMKTDQMVPMVSTLSEPAQINRSHRRSISQRARKPPNVVTANDGGKPPTNPPSPSTSVSSVASSPSRSSMPLSTPGTSVNHSRRPSEFGAVERFKQSHLEGDGTRRNSMPSRLRTASVSTSGDGSVSDHWPGSVGHTSGHVESSTPPSSVGSLDLRRLNDPNDRALTCLVAEDNPITAKIIETLLIRLGCRVVVVSDGSEAISVAHGEIKFDCILMDLHMPAVDGENAARYIKSTANKNSSVPIIAVSAYCGNDTNMASNLFAASLSKPVQKADLLAAMRQLGFKTSSHHEGGQASMKVVTAR